LFLEHEVENLEMPLGITWKRKQKEKRKSTKFLKDIKRILN